ncbi:MAG: cytidine deaminase [Verrucomicrobia bacterium RIFCSPLOWO2_12_FULL_64_8]|nr:MAG: cytidine deaminase [Verrucomicrobia bacterium RIFCSPLOWO2_12_FULL_64_8]
MRLSSALRRKLLASARRAAGRAYAPYSRFRVGAAVLTASGKVYTGANVENASYGLTNCAERTAIFNAVAAGERKVVAVAVFTPTRKPNTPCGACRQVIHEFGPRAVILCACNTSARIETSLDRLLTEAFGPKSLR